MRLSSISDDDLKLIKAIKPFMSNNSQEIIDMTVNILQIFKPEEPGQKINLDALTSFLSVINESFEAEKAAILNKKENKSPDESEVEVVEDDQDFSENEEDTIEENNKVDEINEEFEEEESDIEGNTTDKASNTENVENLLNLLADQKENDNENY